MGQACVHGDTHTGIMCSCWKAWGGTMWTPALLSADAAATNTIMYACGNRNPNCVQGPLCKLVHRCHGWALNCDSLSVRTGACQAWPIHNGCLHMWGSGFILLAPPTGSPNVHFRGFCIRKCGCFNGSSLADIYTSKFNVLWVWVWVPMNMQPCVY